MKISVVAPSLNQGEFILRTLQSVSRQEGVGIAHVIFDGGRTDSTLDILRNFGGAIKWRSINVASTKPVTAPRSLRYSWLP